MDSLLASLFDYKKNPEMFLYKLILPVKLASMLACWLAYFLPNIFTKLLLCLLKSLKQIFLGNVFHFGTVNTNLFYMCIKGFLGFDALRG